LAAAGVTINLPSKIREAQNATEAEPLPVDVVRSKVKLFSVEDDDANAASIDPYSLIISSWSELVRTFDDALQRLGVERRDWRGPSSLLLKLKKLGAISDGLYGASRDLLEIRNQVKRNGPGKFSGLGIDAKDAEIFASTAQSIAAAVDSWLKNNSHK